MPTISKREPRLATDRPGLLVISDKGFASRAFEVHLAFWGAELPHPSFKREKKRKGGSLLRSVRQLIEPINDTQGARGAWAQVPSPRRWPVPPSARERRGPILPLSGWAE